VNVSKIAVSVVLLVLDKRVGSHSRAITTVIADVNRWDEFCMAESATTIHENGVRRQYAVPRRVVQRSSTLLVLESPRMSLTRDALWHNGL
jgi:hypothetical protein